MAFGIGDELSVTITARTQDVERGVESVRDKLSALSQQALETAGFLQLLSSEADDAGDEMSEAGTKAVLASAGVSAFGSSAGLSALGVNQLSTAVFLSLIPALTTLSAALIPVVAALGGFVAVAGSIAGFGMVGLFGAIATHTTELKAAFNTLVATIKREFAPVFDLAALVISDLLQTLTGTISELVPAREVLTRLALSFWELGEAIIAVLPAFSSLAATLATEFLPPFVEFAQRVLPQLPGLIRRLVGAFRRVLPLFIAAGREMARVAPELLDFGFAALNVVAPALGVIAGALTGAVSAFNDLSGGVQQALLQLSLFLPVLATVGTLIGGVTGPLMALVGAVGAVGVAFQQDLGRVRAIVTRVWRDLQQVLGNRLPALLDAARGFWKTWGDEITLVVEGVADILGTTLVAAVDLVVSALTALLEFASGDFKAGFNTLASFFGRFVRRIGKLVNRLTGGLFEDVVNGVIQMVNAVGSAFEKFANMVGLDGFEFEKLQQVDFSAMPVQGGQQGREQRSLSTTGQGTTVNVEVEGDTEVIKDVSAEVADERYRENSRETAQRADNYGVSRQ